MKNYSVSNNEFPIAFQEEVVALIKKLVDVSAVRFCLINPKLSTMGFVFYNIDSKTEETYHYKYGVMDPLHPDNFKDTDISVVCSNTLMSDEKWRETKFYKEFMAPRNYDYNADIFFRKDDQIIAVLSVIRSDRKGPFNKDELTLFENLRPFMEYSLNSIYVPKRIEEREFFSKKYSLTNRELDVLEAVMEGAEIKVIARKLDLGVATVKTHLQHIFDKVGVRSTKELISTLFRELSLS